MAPKVWLPTNKVKYKTSAWSAAGHIGGRTALTNWPTNQPMLCVWFVMRSRCWESGGLGIRHELDANPPSGNNV